jgi:hypothetical protein
MPSSIVHGLDTIPRQIFRDFPEIFSKYLPNWSITGEYNFQAGASTQKAAAQLELLNYGDTNYGDTILIRYDDTLARKPLSSHTPAMESLPSLISIMSSESPIRAIHLHR